MFNPGLISIKLWRNSVNRLCKNLTNHYTIFTVLKFWGFDDIAIVDALKDKSSWFDFKLRLYTVIGQIHELCDCLQSYSCELYVVSGKPEDVSRPTTSEGSSICSFCCCIVGVLRSSLRIILLLIILSHSFKNLFWQWIFTQFYFHLYSVWRTGSRGVSKRSCCDGTVVFNTSVISWCTGGKLASDKVRFALSWCFIHCYP